MHLLDLAAMRPLLYQPALQGSTTALKDGTIAG